MNPRKDLYLVAASLFAWGLGEGLFYIFQPLYLQELGADPVLIGTVLGINGFGMAVAQIPAGYLSDRIGRRPIMWFSWIMGVVATAVMAISHGLTGFVIGLVIYGITTAALAPMNSYIASARGNWSVGRALTFTSAAYNLGAMLGPLAGGLIAEQFGLRFIFKVSAGFFIISTLIIFLISKQPVTIHQNVTLNGNLFKNSRFMLSLGMVTLIMFVLYLPQPLTANFLQNERGLSFAAIGTLGSVQNVGNVLFLLALGHLAPMKGFLLSEIALIGVSLLLWKSTGMPFFSIAYLLKGGYRLSRSLSSAFIRPVVQDSQVGTAFGFVESACNIAFMLAPMLAGLLYKQNPESVYLVSLVLLAATLFLTLVVNQNKAKLKNRFPQ